LLIIFTFIFENSPIWRTGQKDLPDVRLGHGYWNFIISLT